MTVDISYERADESAFPFDAREVIEKTIVSALDYENCEYDVYIEVV